MAKTQIPGFLWDEKDVIAKLPSKKVCCVYYYKSSTKKMSHTGLYCGNGFVIHAEGHAVGVINEKLEDFPWTHFAYKDVTDAQAKAMVVWAESMVGNPYIIGAYKRECTPAFRKNRAAAYPTYKANIYKYCPVLSGAKSSCTGCKYKGKLAFDCAQFTRYTYHSVGLYLPSGASNQYYEWIPDNAPGISSAVTPDVPDTIRKGSSGSDVKTLQGLLNDNGASLKVDGKFGQLTRDAVIAYQKANGLNVDGVVGPQTWTALLYPDADPDEPPTETVEVEPTYTVTIPDCTLVRANAILGVYKSATMTLQK